MDGLPLARQRWFPPSAILTLHQGSPLDQFYATCSIELCRFPNRTPSLVSAAAPSLIPAPPPSHTLPADTPDKANQDAACAVEKLGGQADHHLFGVFDGHGEFGAECATFVKDKVPQSTAITMSLPFLCPYFPHPTPGPKVR